MSSISTLVTDPNAFFRDRREHPSWKGPVLILTLIALVGVASSVVQIRATSELMSQLATDAGAEDTFQTFFQAFQLVGVILGFVWTYVLWALWAGIFYGLSALMDGTGTFGTTLKLVGWGFVPSFIGSVISLFITVYRFEIEGFTPPPPNAGMQANQEFIQSLSSGPLVALSAVLGVVFTLWAGVLWTFAMKHARQLTTRQAAVSVAFPVLLGLAGSAWGLINAL
jgi:hypothetical protein